MHIYRFSLCLAFTFVILVDRPVYAEWVALDARHQLHPLQTAYLDPNIILKEGHLVTLSALIDWKWMQGNRSPTRFFSTKITKQFDCAEKLVRTLVATDFYGHMGTGEIIGGGGHTSEGHWAPVEPGTLNQGLWEVTCGKE